MPPPGLTRMAIKLGRFPCRRREDAQGASTGLRQLGNRKGIVDTVIKRISREGMLLLAAVLMAFAARQSIAPLKAQTSANEAPSGRSSAEAQFRPSCQTV
jgi:hypothetical protein